MALNTLPPGAFADNAITSDKINLANNFAFTGTVTGASDVVLVDTKTISSGSANIDFTSGIGSTYDFYQFHIINVDVSADTNLQLRYSTDGGSSFVSDSNTYEYASRGYNSNNEFGTNPSTGDTKMDLTFGGSQLDDGAAHNGNMIITMAGHADSNTRCTFFWHIGLVSHGSNYATGGYGAGSIKTTTHNPNAIRFKLSGSGNTFDSGKMKLYGVR